MPGSPPAYRVATDRLVIRCWNPDDAPALQAAIDENIDHLRPFLPWAAREPQALDAKVALLRHFRADFDRDEDFVYGIFDAAEREVVGGTGLHPRVGEGGLEIGYWIRAARTRQGYATEAAGALTRVGFELHALRWVEIRCATTNTRSAAVPRRLGYTLQRTLPDRAVLGDGTLADQQFWALFAADYPSSAAARTGVKAFDAVGRRVI
jgi:RimJ/RimL family protein N-acetyltransferase